MNKDTLGIYSEIIEKLVDNSACKIIQASIEPVGDSNISIKSIAKIQFTITDKENSK